MAVHWKEMQSRYRRAALFMQGYKSTRLVQNETILPTWIGKTNYFWYKRAGKMAEKISPQTCHEYRLVNAETKVNEMAFDHCQLASALTKASGKRVDSTALPISNITLALSPLMVTFNAFRKRWIFDGEKNKCRLCAIPFLKDDEAPSPDGRWIAFVKDYNLWLHEVATGRELPLTSDGEQDYFYGLGSTAWGASLFPEPPALWSPDSMRLITVRRDKRLVKTLPHVCHVPLDGSIRPQLNQFKVAYPGDEYVETYEMIAFDIKTRQICQANLPPIPTCKDGNDLGGFLRHLSWWALDNLHAFFIDRALGMKRLRLMRFDTQTGITRQLIEETSDSYVNITPDGQCLPLYRHLPQTNEMIWWSERSGWGHLYLYDLGSGELKNPITSGDWVVRDILYLDIEGREVYVQTGGRVVGRDPYYRDVCRVNIDTGEISTLLSSDHDYIVHYPNSVLAHKLVGEASDHTGGIAANGSYLIVTRTRANELPATFLIDKEGNRIMDLEMAELSASLRNWRWPEPVKFTAADNETDIYGLVFRPSYFTPKKKYPVINYINSGPWLSVVPKGSFHTSRGYADRHYFYSAALAELGFIVLNLDSRGTPLRSKAFQEYSYGWIPASANTEDHVGAIKQLGKRYSYADLDNVGMCSLAYRSGLQNFLERQDIYKVGVQMSLLDSRLISRTIEGDTYEGVEGPEKDNLYPEQLIEKLSGKLLLMLSMNNFTSSAYPPAGTFRVIDALQKANKDFDLVIVPNTVFVVDGYMHRRSWDYLVRNLMGEEPPKEFNLKEVSVAGVSEELLNRQ